MLLGISGCATVPVQDTLPKYTLHGVTYYPLAELCSKKGVIWEYDTYSRTITLRKNQQRSSVRVGDSLAILNGASKKLSHPVDVYRGTIVVPQAFKDKIIDMMAYESVVSQERPFARSRIRKIVVDAGHGGKDPGTVGRTGLKEKDVNLDISRRLAKLLRDEGAEVVLTRSSDVFIPLGKRTEIANNARADLFVSVHSNANRVRSLKGFEAYYISTAAGDLKRALSSSDQMPEVDRVCFSETVPSSVKTILWDMLYTSNRAESIDVAKHICRTVGRNLNSKVLGVKSANFQVLRGTEMPAVLVEIGFLSNPSEEQLLKSTHYRQQVAEALVEGVREYAASYPLQEAKQ